MRSFLAAALLFTAAAHAQVQVDPARFSERVQKLIATGDDAPLLQCVVNDMKPGLTFGFRFQSGYLVSLPLKQFVGKGHFWIILTRITPEDGKPADFIQTVRLPEVPATKEWGEVGGGYMLGPGAYRAQLTLVDDARRVCRKEWKIEAKLTHADRGVKLAMPPGTVAGLSLRAPKTLDDRDDIRPLRITVLLHAAPLNPRRSKLRPMDTLTLLGSLGALLDRVPVRSLRLVAFNLEQQKEIFRQDNFQLDSLEKLEDAMSSQELGLVDYKVLQNPNGHLDLLADLINQEIAAKESPDVVLFMGPLSRVSAKVAQDALEKPKGGAPRFFYFQFRPLFRRPSSTFPDSINLAMSRLKGKTNIITTPGEFAKAITQMENQVAGK